MSPLASTLAQQASTRLQYSIHSCSSISGNFIPQNVLHDTPHDPSSRWAGEYLSFTSHASSQHPLASSSTSPSSSSKGGGANQDAQDPLSGVNLSGETFAPASRWGVGRRHGTLAGERGGSPAGVSAGGLGTSLLSATGDLSPGRNWLMVEFKTPCILRKITFGKLAKPHPCTIKAFVVLAGLKPTELKQVLYGTLKHDGSSEEFHVGWREAGRDGLPVPTRFVKIVPLSAQGQNYNTSIWHLAFAGIDNPDLVQQAYDEYTAARQARTLRLMLKHLRRSRLNAAFENLLATTLASADSFTPSSTASSPISYEHPLLSELHKTLVEAGDFGQAEKLISRLSAEGLYNTFLENIPARTNWTRLDSPSPPSGNGATEVVEGDAEMTNADENDPSALVMTPSGHQIPPTSATLATPSGGSSVSASAAPAAAGPSKRAGHQLVLDEGDDARPARLYLFGGWDGLRDYDDFWSWEEGGASAGGGGWTRIARPDDGAPWPVARSCHQMVLDPTTGVIWLTGRHVEMEEVLKRGVEVAGAGEEEGGESSSSASATPKPWHNDLWKFDSRGTRQWVCISMDTASQGGPSLIFDHEMIIDSERQQLYVFGGSDGTPAGAYSGMFRYDISSGTWTRLLEDNERGLRSRAGHCMVWHPTERSIYIFGGLRSPLYLADVWTYHPDTDILECLTSDYTLHGPAPAPAFTQRAVLDASRTHIVTMSGLTRQPSSAVVIPAEGSASAASAGRITARGELWALELASGRWMKMQSAASVPATSVKKGGVEDEKWRAERSWLAGEATVGGSKMGAAAETNGEEVREEPVARYAHQFVLDSKSDTYYLFGGNSGKNDPKTTTSSGAPVKERLRDFWELKVDRVGKAEVERRCLLALRRQRYDEMCETAPMLESLTYLTSQLESVVDQSDPEESHMYSALAAHMFTRPPASYPPDGMASPPSRSPGPPSNEVFAKRTDVFDVIQRFIGDPALKEPEGDLEDMVDVGAGMLVF